MAKLFDLFNKVKEVMAKFLPDIPDPRDFVPEPGAKEIRESDRGEVFARRLTYKLRDRQYMTRALTIDVDTDDDGNIVSIFGHIGYKPRTFSKSTWFARVHQEAVYASNSGLMEVLDRYSDLYLQVTYPEGAVGAQLMDRMIVILDGDYYIETENGGDFQNLVTQAVVERSKVLGNSAALLYNRCGDGMDEDEAGFDSSSAGETKRLAIPFMLQNMDWVSPRLLKYVLTSGASEYLMGAAKSMKDIAQANNRWSLADAPSTMLGRMGVVCWHLGKFRDEEDHDVTDGLGYLSDLWFSRTLSMNSKGKFYFYPKSVRGLCVQMRPATCKLLAWCVSQFVIGKLIDRYGQGKNLVLKRSEITEEHLLAFQAVVKDKENRVGWSGYNLFICDTDEERDAILAGDYGCVQFYTDLNGLKAPYDLRMPLDYGALDVTHAPEDIEKGANMSTQLYQSILLADAQRGEKLGLGAFSKQILRKFRTLEDNEGVAPSVSELGIGCNYSQFLAKLAPVCVRKFYFPLLKTVADKMIEGLVNRAVCLNIETAGCYCKILPDPAVIFNKHILKIVKDGDKPALQCIQGAAARAGYKRGVGVKYPKEHWQEYGQFLIHGKDWYIDQVKESEELTAEEKIIILDIMSEVSDGVIIIPAYEIIKKMLAGLDYDGDGLVLYLDPELVDIILSNLEMLAVDKDSDVEIPREKQVPKEWIEDYLAHADEY